MLLNSLHQTGPAHLISHLRDTKPHHPRVECESAFDLVLHFRGAVKGDEKVVALVVLGLVLGGRARQVELAPVGDGADGAVGAEDGTGGGEGDSVRKKWDISRGFDGSLCGLRVALSVCCAQCRCLGGCWV